MVTVEQDSGRKPPYAVPWATFTNFLDKLEREGVPNRIDPTLMTNMSGQVRSYMTGLLKFFGAINEQKIVQPILHELANGETRKPTVAQLPETHYPKIVELGKTNSTLGELNEAFTELGVNGADPRTKAIRFYLFAADFAGIKTSPHWSAPKAAAARTAGPRPTKRVGRKKPKPELEVNETPSITPSAGAPTSTVELSSGGRVTLTYDMNLFEATEEDRAFVLKLIDEIKGYAAAHRPKAPRKKTPVVADPLADEHDVEPVDNPADNPAEQGGEP